MRVDRSTEHEDRSKQGIRNASLPKDRKGPSVTIASYFLSVVRFLFSIPELRITGLLTSSRYLDR